MTACDFFALRDSQCGELPGPASPFGPIQSTFLCLLYNAPLDILIERRLSEIPEMREAQVCSLFLQMHNTASVGLDQRSRSVVPAPLLRMNDGLNGAMALFVDELTGGASEFFPPYEEAIKRLTLEAAVLGQEGISYSDTARRHRLKSAPGEEFTGLEIMCLLYAGMKASPQAKPRSAST